MEYLRDYLRCIFESNAQVFDREAVKRNGVLGINGRTGRKEYWYNFFGYAILSYVFAHLFSSQHSLSPALLFFPVSFSMYVFFMTIRLEVRRFHDVGYSGWAYLILNVIGLLVPFFFFAKALFSGYVSLVNGNVLASLIGALSGGILQITFVFIVPIAIRFTIFAILCFPSQEGINQYDYESESDEVNDAKEEL